MLITLHISMILELNVWKPVMLLPLNASIIVTGFECVLCVSSLFVVSKKS